MNLDYDKLTFVFSALTERLTNLEIIQESIHNNQKNIIEAHKFNERRHYGEINSSIFNWNFKVTRLTGIDNEDHINKPACELMSCAYLSDNNTAHYGIPNDFVENLILGKYDSMLNSLKIDRECLKTKERESGEECVTCKDLHLQSHFKYVYTMIAQEIINDMLKNNSDWTRILVTPDGDGIWFWKKTPGTIDDFVNMFQKIMNAWDFEIVSNLELYDVCSNKAYYAYLLEKWNIEKEIDSICQKSTLRSILKLQKKFNFKFYDFENNFLWDNVKNNFYLILSH